jgi:hypothetical protein
MITLHEPPRYARLVCPDGYATLSIDVTGEPALPARAQLYFQCEALDDLCYCAGRSRHAARMGSQAFGFVAPSCCA